jgi:hypothetical protein
MSRWVNGSFSPAAMRICVLHDVDAGDQFGHRVLDLHPGVHLDEIELAVLVQELEGAGAAVADLRQASAQRSPMRSISARDARRRRLLDDLLVAALHRAVALAQIDRVAVGLSASTWISMWRGFSRNFSM